MMSLIFDIQHTEENIQKRPIHSIHVPYAKTWRSRQDFIEKKPSDNSVALEKISSLDWTYSSDYCFTILDTHSQKTSEETYPQIVSAFNISNLCSPKEVLQWQIAPATSSGVDYDMLRRQDLPILLYDECLLYQVIFSSFLFISIRVIY